MIKAKYTVVLKTLLDNPDTRDLIEKALSKYPLYQKKSDETYIPSVVPTRDQLNYKILNSYKYREIGFETVGRFIEELEISMAEIMPYYNQLLFSADQDFNILFNVDYQRTTTTDRKDTSKSKASSTDTANTETATESNDSSNVESTIDNASKNVHSATPGSQLDIGARDINNVEYADDASWNKNESSDTSHTSGESKSSGTSKATNTSSGESSGESEGKENIVETTKGNFGVISSQDLILKYRETILNIEQMIINDKRISELFMMIY